MNETDLTRNVQIMSRARTLATSGEFDTALEIVTELLREGCSDAPMLLSGGTVQLELNDLCARARKSRPAG